MKRRILSLCLILALVACMALPAFAALSALLKRVHKERYTSYGNELLVSTSRNTFGQDLFCGLLVESFYYVYIGITSCVYKITQENGKYKM